MIERKTQNQSKVNSEPTHAIKDSKPPKTCSDLAKMNINELPN